jgi:hypothetical protein
MGARSIAPCDPNVEPGAAIGARRRRDRRQNACTPVAGRLFKHRADHTFARGFNV